MTSTRGEMLRLAQDDLGDADLARVADRLAQQRVGASAALAWLQVVGRLEEPFVDLVGVDEVEDVDRLGFLERGGLEVVLGQDDELTLLVLVPLDQIFPADRLPFGLADALVAAPAIRPSRGAGETSAGDRAPRCTAPPGCSPARTRSTPFHMHEA